MKDSAYQGGLIKRCVQIFLALMLVLQLVTPTTSNMAVGAPSGESTSTASAETSQTAQTPVPAASPLLMGALLGASGPTGSPLDAPEYGQISLVKFTYVSNGCMGGIAVDSSGAVWSWGYNLYGELGIGGTVASVTGVSGANNYYGGMKRIPYFVTNGIKITEIGASYETRFALGSNGVVYAWGEGNSGAMGNGSTTGTNYTPAPVTGLPPIAHIYASDSYLNQGSCMALATDGTVWAWGRNASNQLGLGNTGAIISTPTQVTLPSALTDGTRHIVKIAVGRTSAFIIDDQGDVWTCGADNYGQQGNGNTTVANSTFTLMDRSVSGMAQVVDIDASYTALQNSADRIVACDVNGNAWEWGSTFGDGGSANSRIDKSTPQMIVVDPAAAAAVGYQPEAKQVTASEMVGYFIDQHGRPWAWGSGYYFGFGRDGGYGGGATWVYTYGYVPTASQGSNTELIRSTGAEQIPNIIGDGDTQYLNSSAKIPIYLGGTLTPTTPAGGIYAQGTGPGTGVAAVGPGYGFNNLHPTIYDEKYMLKDSNGNILDTDGNTCKIAAATTVDGVSGLTRYCYYQTDANGKIISPAVQVLPAHDPEDELWIRLAMQPVPYITEFDASLSAYAFLDADGNLYKWGNDGSGAIAWGWDYTNQYDQNGNTTSGLYDRYTYEVMYMRGAPTIDQLNVTATGPTKVYTPAGTDATAPVSVSVHIPASTTSAALDGDSVYSDLTRLQYVFVPYDTSNSDFTQDVSTMTDAQFQALYDSSAVKGDLISSPISSTDSPQDLSYTVNAPANGKVIVWATNERYVDDSMSGGQAYQTITNPATSATIDTIYTEANVEHTGIGTATNGAKTTLYAPTDDNVTKTSNDASQTGQAVNPAEYGVPIDANGQAIPNPTYGYDTVDIKSYEAVGNVGLPAGITPYWQFTQPQAEEVSKTLDAGSDVTDALIQPFNYNQNLAYWTDVSGEKTWADNDNSAGKRPTSVDLTLNEYARDPSTGQKGDFITSLETTTVTPDAQGNWKFDFGLLKSYEYTYDITETAVPGYQTSITYPNLMVAPTTNEDLSSTGIVNTLIEHDLTKTVSAPTASDGKYHVGDTLTYTITAANKSDASDTWSNVMVEDGLPAGLSLVSVSGGTNTGTGNDVKVSLGDITGGQTKQITVTATVLASAAGTTVVNTAVATSDNDGPVQPPSNETTVSPVHAMTKTVSAPTAADGKYHAGDTLTYTITAENKSDVSDVWKGVTITDSLPAGLTLVSVSGGTDTGSGNNVSVSVGDIIGGQTKTITVVATVDASAAGTTISNVAVANSANDDPITSPPAQIYVTGLHNLTKTVSDPTAADGKYHVGDTLTYTIIASNQSDATDTWSNVVVEDSLPAGLSLVSVSGGTNTGTGNDVKVSLGDITGGQTKTITVTATVLASAAGTTVVNTAIATSDNDGPVQPPSNETPVGPVHTMTKTVSAPTAADGKYHAGDTLTYTITAANKSDTSDTWKGVVITDSLPAGLSLVSVSGGTNTGSGNNVSVSVGDIIGGQTKTITVVATVDASAAGTTISNVAVANSTNDDPITSPPSDVYVTGLHGLTKTVSAPTATDHKYHVGDTLTYTITATNNSDASDTWSNVVVEDSLPAGLSFVNATGGNNSGSGNDVKVALGDITGGQSKTITIVATVLASAAGTTITNTAIATSDNDGPVQPPSNETPVSPVHDLTKTVAPSTSGDGKYHVGDTLTYTIVASNKSDASDVWSNVVVEDSLPAGLSFVGVTGGNNSGSGNDVKIALGDIAGGQSKTITIKATVLAAAAGTTVVNTAVATSDNDNPIQPPSNETTVNGTTTVTINYHYLSPTGPVAGAPLAIPDVPIGQPFDPTPYLDKYLTPGYANGVPDTPGPWDITGENPDFTVYYPDTPPTITVARDLIVRTPVQLTSDDILRIAGVSVTDAEETIPVSAVQITGYNDIDWNAPDAPQVYTLTLNVKDTPGLAADPVTMTVTVMPADTTVTPPSPTDPAYRDLPSLPQDDLWGTTDDSKPIIYIPTMVHTLVKTVDKATAADGKYHVGDTLTYTITASNKSDAVDVWSNVIVTDNLPAGLTLLSVTGDGTNNSTGNTVSVSLGDLTGGQSKTITIKATVGLSAAGTTIVNTAVATSDNDKPIQPPSNETTVNGTTTVTINYHYLSPDGAPAGTLAIPDVPIGQPFDPTPYLDKYLGAGYAHGVADTPGPWDITSENPDFTVYYPDTPPTINIEREVLYIRQPAKLSLADIIRIAGVSISDPEETIPLSALQVTGYEGVNWDVANYGDGAYVLTLNVKDTPGLSAPVRQIAIFVEPPEMNITPVDKSDPKYADLPWLPAGMDWGIDEDGNLAIYIPVSAPEVVTAIASALPQTGDMLSATIPLAALTGALLLFLLLYAQRKASSVIARRTKK